MRRIALLVLIAALAATEAHAQAQFPTAPVRILVPFAAGGPTDVVARILADEDPASRHLPARQHAGGARRLDAPGNGALGRDRKAAGIKAE
jgi:hypothetical protein